MTDVRAVRRLFEQLAPGYDHEVPFFTTFGRDLIDCGHRRRQLG